MDIFSGLIPSDVAKPLASNAEYCLAWRKKFFISKDLNPQSQIPSTTSFLCSILTALLSSVVQGMGFSTESVVSGL